jgi:GAF domain-containing protein
MDSVPRRTPRKREDVELAETFADVARVLMDHHDVDSTLDQICLLAVRTIDGCESAGISIAQRERVTSRSTTDDIPRIVDRIQSETQQGPCVDAIREHEVFFTGCLSQETRWPHFARRANDETGIQSILSLRLFAAENTIGALNMYSTLVDAFDDQDVAVGSVFAAHAAVALDNATREQDLENKAISRDVIGMAKGIIMARQQVTEAEAFDILRRASQRMNIKLRDLANRVVHPAPGETPDDDEPTGDRRG